MRRETKEFVISEELKRKVKMICRFSYVENSVTNGNVKSIKNTNIVYVKPHIVKINNINYLLFDNSDYIFINDYYTPFIKSKLNNKELDKQLDRIKAAYIKGVMKLEDFDKGIKHIEFQRNNLETKLKEQKQYENLDFTIDDLLILQDKQNMDIFIKPEIFFLIYIDS